VSKRKIPVDADGKPKGAKIVNFQIHRNPNPEPPLVSMRTPYACPNCGAELRDNGSCPRCPTWARPPGLRPYPPAA
jgi:hypothetical protein